MTLEIIARFGIQQIFIIFFSINVKKTKVCYRTPETAKWFKPKASATPL
jgi:hypothetical protein